MTSASSFTRTLVVDSGFWYALYNPRDQHHVAASKQVELLQTCNLIVPWPSLYETFNTRFAKNSTAVLQFHQLLLQPGVIRLSDEVYREDALRLAISSVRSRCFALVDVVIRLILEDTSVRKHGLLTFNCADFGDLCKKHRIEML